MLQRGVSSFELNNRKVSLIVYNGFYSVTSVTNAIAM